MKYALVKSAQGAAGNLSYAVRAEGPEMVRGFLAYSESLCLSHERPMAYISVDWARSRVGQALMATMLVVLENHQWSLLKIAISRPCFARNSD